MLFAKDLKVALAAAIAVVGLLGFNMAHATVYITPSASENSDPVYFAAEAYRGVTLPMGVNATKGRTVTASSTNSFTVVDNAIDVLLNSGENYYVRFELKGAAGFAFAKDAPLPTATAGTLTFIRAQDGRAGGAVGIWRVSSTSTDAEAGSWGVSLAIEADGITLPRFPSATVESCYEIELSVWDQLGDAKENLAEALQKASAKLVCLTPTVSASFGSPQMFTADVAENFRRFTGATPTGGTLGTASIATTLTKKLGVGTSARTLFVLNPADGMRATAADVLTRVDYTFSGEFSNSGAFSFGEFTLGGGALARYDSEDKAISAAVGATAAGKTGTVTVRGARATVGDHPFVVNVAANDATKATNSYSQIGAGTYSVAWQVVLPGETTAARATPPGAAENAGQIKRNGTTVRVGYLTTATGFGAAGSNRSYNQRLVISNHGNSDATVTLGDFVVEDGAEMPDAVTWTVPGNEKLVVPVAEAITIGGCRVAMVGDDCARPFSRAAATLTATIKESDISVFTTTVTRPEGQTDTVRYWPLQ